MTKKKFHAAFFSRRPTHRAERKPPRWERGTYPPPRSIAHGIERTRHIVRKGLLSTSEPFLLVGLWLLTVVPACVPVCLSVSQSWNDDTAFPCSCRAVLQLAAAASLHRHSGNMMTKAVYLHVYACVCVCMDESYGDARARRVYCKDR